MCVLAVAGFAGISSQLRRSPRPPPPPSSSSPISMSPATASGWAPANGSSHIADFTHLASEQCKTYIAGIPQTGAPNGEIVCPPYATHPDLIAWPESPAPFFEDDARFQKALVGIAHANRRRWSSAISAWIIRRDRQLARVQLRARRRRRRRSAWAATTRFISSPSASMFPSATCSSSPANSPARSRGSAAATSARSSALNGHRYGVFICYEAVFADEVRQFARLGAEVLVNISDDGWYGDTSAPWQHLNMARMRAIENRRWILRDTNNGVTAAIDPYGRVRQSIPRHQADALPAHTASATTSPSTPRTATSSRGFVPYLVWGLSVWAARRSLGGLSPLQKSKQSQVIRAKHVIKRSRIRLRSRARPGSRPAGVSLTPLASAGNSPTSKRSWPIRPSGTIPPPSKPIMRDRKRLENARRRRRRTRPPHRRHRRLLRTGPRRRRRARRS